MSPLQDIIGNSTEFLTKIFSELKEHGVSTDWEIDHLCYRVSSLDRYEVKKAELQTVGTLLTEAKVSGRLIATFKLHVPIHFQNKRIPLVELPAPKAGRQDIEGLQHFEFVIPDDLLKFAGRYPHLEFDIRGASKKINPDIALDLPSGEVKFHNESLEVVIERELAAEHK
jgi:predicted metalloenzyme YecM